MGFIDKIGNGLVSGVGSLFGGLFGAIGQRKTNKTNLKIARETNQANRELAEQQNKWNIEQWNRENEYNSPLNQINLLKEAGLNPNLYGGEGGTAGSLVSADLANQQAATVENPLRAFEGLNIAQSIADIAKTKSETKANEAKAGLDKTRAVNEMKQGQFIEALNKSQLQLNNSTISVNQSVKDMNKAQANVLKKKIVEMDQHIHEMQSNIAKNAAGVALTFANINKMDQEMQIQWQRLNLDKEQLAAQKLLWRATRAQLISQARLNGKQAEALDLATALNSCTFNYQVKGARIQVESAAEGLRNVKVMNEINENWAPYEKGFGILSSMLGSIASCLIGYGAVTKGVKPATAVGMSLLNPSTSVARP